LISLPPTENPCNHLMVHTRTSFLALIIYSTIDFLISEIAFAGLRPFGHVLLQLRMV